MFAERQQLTRLPGRGKQGSYANWLYWREAPRSKERRPMPSARLTTNLRSLRFLVDT